MPDPNQHRRRFLTQTSVGGVAALLAYPGASVLALHSQSRLHVACNEYPWRTFYRRQKRDFRQDLDLSLAKVASSGVDGFEPMADSPDAVAQLVPLLTKHGLAMRSLYVNSVLHQPDQVRQSSEQVVAIAGRAQELAGTKIVVTNPSPLRWGSGEDKTDEQLKRQAEALDQLGGRLRSMGMTLAYHNHDVELRQAAREFHHMLVGTAPEHVTLCLDAHWVYRGSGNSSVALFDVLRLYGPRVTELHLRQSRDGVWTESFDEGDIDYVALATYLRTIGVKPHIVLEQAIEQGTPDTLTAVDAHRQSRAYADKTFSQLAT